MQCPITARTHVRYPSISHLSPLVMKRSFLRFGSILLLGVFAQVGSADWTYPNGDPQNARRTQFQFRPPYTTRWEVPCDLFQEPPIVSRGKVYVITRDRVLNALDTRDGLTLWRNDLLATSGIQRLSKGLGKRHQGIFTPVPVVVGDQVIAACSSLARGVVISIDARKGTTNWVTKSEGVTGASPGSKSSRRVVRARTRGPVLSGPVVWKDRIIVRTGGGLSAFRSKDGRELWNVPLDAIAFQALISVPQPAVDESAVYIGPSLGQVIAIDPRSGRRLWSRKTGTVRRISTGHTVDTTVSPSMCPPVISAGMLVVADGKAVVAMRSSNGQQLWKTEVGEPWQMAVAEGGIYVASIRGLFHLDPRTGATIHSLALPGGAWSCIVGRQHALVGMSARRSDGFAVVDRKTFRVLWRQSGFRTFYGMAVGSDMIIAGGLFRDGYIRPGIRSSVLRGFRAAD